MLSAALRQRAVQVQGEGGRLHEEVQVRRPHRRSLQTSLSSRKGGVPQTTSRRRSHDPSSAWNLWVLCHCSEMMIYPPAAVALQCLWGIEHSPRESEDSPCAGSACSCTWMCTPPPLISGFAFPPCSDVFCCLQVPVKC